MAPLSDWRLVAVSSLAKALNKRSFPLKYGDNHIGRNKVCDIKIPSTFCSKIHCNITVDGEFVTLIDRSRNGTFVNYRRILNQCSASLKEDDTITIAANIDFQSDRETNDRNAFVYSLVRDEQETIEIIDSDEENNVEDSTQENILEPSTISNESNDAVIELLKDLDADKFLEIKVPVELDEQQSNVPSNLLDTPQENTIINQQIDEDNSKGGKITAKRTNEVNISDLVGTFGTNIKVKVAKISRANMLLADMLSPSAAYDLIRN